MGLRSLFAATLPGIFEAAGEEAIFTPGTGLPINCHIFIDFDVDLQPSGTVAQVWERGTTIEALLSEIVREPNRGETFIFDNDVYTVQTIISNDGLTVKMAVS